MASSSINFRTSGATPCRINCALSLAITFACAGEMSPIASAAVAPGKYWVSVLATSIRPCAVEPDIRSAVAISSRSESSTPEYIESARLGSLPATTTIALCIQTLNQPLCFSNTAR